MKKIVVLTLTLAMAFSMVACGAKTEETPAATEEAVVETTETTADAESEATADASSEATTEAEDVKSEGVMTYAEYVAAELETEVVVETYVQAKQGWWEDKATLYTQDKDGAYFIYEMPCSEEEYEKLVPGTKIKVTGVKTEWSGEVEITEAAYEILEGSYIAEPTDVTAYLASEELVNYQNQFVSFKGLTVEPVLDKDGNVMLDADGNEVPYIYNWDGSGEDGNDVYFYVSLDGQTYQFLVESYLCDNTTDVYAAAKNLQVGDVVDMEGFLYWYNGVNPHITAITVVE